MPNTRPPQELTKVLLANRHFEGISIYTPRPSRFSKMLLVTVKFWTGMAVLQPIESWRSSDMAKSPNSPPINLQRATWTLEQVLKPALKAAPFLNARPVSAMDALFSKTIQASNPSPLITVLSVSVIWPVMEMFGASLYMIGMPGYEGSRNRVFSPALSACVTVAYVAPLWPRTVLTPAARWYSLPAGPSTLTPNKGSQAFTVMDLMPVTDPVLYDMLSLSCAGSFMTGLPVDQTEIVSK